jgi:hypothetical protein
VTIKNEKLNKAKENMFCEPIHFKLVKLISDNEMELKAAKTSADCCET